MEEIHIALPSDQNYVIGLTTTAGSIAYYASKDVKLIMHILDGGINDDTFDDFSKKIYRLHPNVEFNRIKVDKDLFNSFPAWSGNRMTYARLMLASALPNIEHIVYCDTDFLWLIDIADLWSLRKRDVPLASVGDFESTKAIEKTWAEEHGLNFDPDKYFCAGLSLYNLRLFREENTINKVADFLNKYPDVKFADQTAMYYMFKDRVELLPEKWQSLSLNLTPEKVREPLAIHYAGDIPWKKGKFWAYPISDSTLLWLGMTDLINNSPRNTALKELHTPWQCVYKRFLAYIYKNTLTASLFNLVLRCTGRESYVSYFESFSQNLKIGPRKIRKLIMAAKAI